MGVLVHVRGQWRPPLSQTAAVGGGMEEDEVGALAPKSNQRPLPTPPEQQDSMELTAGGASESFGIESTTKKTVSRQFVRWSDVWNLPGASPRPSVPNRSSTLLGRDSQTGIYLRPVSHKAVWLRLKVRAPVFEGVEHESDLAFSL